MTATVAVLLTVVYFVLQQLIFGRRHVVYVGKACAHGCVVEKFRVTKRDILFVKYSHPVYRITNPTHTITCYESGQIASLSVACSVVDCIEAYKKAEEKRERVRVLAACKDFFK